jgi:hypothetical protein
MHLCKVCQKEIPERRVKLGYTDTCVDHSDTFKYVGFVSAANTEEYDLSVVKDSDTAKHLRKLQDKRMR